MEKIMGYVLVNLNMYNLAMNETFRNMKKLSFYQKMSWAYIFGLCLNSLAISAMISDDRKKMKSMEKRIAELEKAVYIPTEDVFEKEEEKGE